MKKILLFILFCLTITIAQTQIRQMENKHEELVKKIKIYPNPITEYVIFKFDQIFTGNIEIFNRHGVLKKSIHFHQETEKQINVSDFTPDQYLYNITINHQSITTGIIIKK